MKAATMLRPLAYTAAQGPVRSGAQGDLLLSGLRAEFACGCHLLSYKPVKFKSVTGGYRPSYIG